MSCHVILSEFPNHVSYISGVQLSSMYSTDKENFAMLDEIRGKTFVKLFQHGGHDVACTPRINYDETKNES